MIKLQAKEVYAQKVFDTAENHLNKYGYRKMKLQELDKLCGAE